MDGDSHGFIREGPRRLRLESGPPPEDGELDWLLIEGETPEKLLDILSLENDFQAAKVKCQLFLEVQDTPDNDQLRQALWESLVVTYGRAFIGGKGHSGQTRYRLPPDFLEAMTKEQRAIHEELLDVRNRHVAHRVDNRQVGLVYLWVTKDRTRAGPFAKLAEYAHPTPEHVREILALLDVWIGVLQIYAREGAKRLMELAQDDWSDVLMRLDSPSHSKLPRPKDRRV